MASNQGAARERLAGMMVSQQAILHLKAEDGSEWIAGVVMTQLRPVEGDGPARDAVPGDGVTGLTVVA